jgi:hypothetical protein
MVKVKAWKTFDTVDHDMPPQCPVGPSPWLTQFRENTTKKHRPIKEQGQNRHKRKAWIVTPPPHQGTTRVGGVQELSSCNGHHGAVMPDPSTDKDTDPVVMVHHLGNRRAIQHSPGHHWWKHHTSVRADIIQQCHWCMMHSQNKLYASHKTSCIHPMMTHCQTIMAMDITHRTVLSNHHIARWHRTW